jgi:Cys-tRNA(Pro)/Cys-tRNA(Cys) deacylase
MKNSHTNVFRMLEAVGVSCTEHHYDTSDGAIDAVSVARKLGEAPEQVFKTLVTVSNQHDYFVFAVPAAEELDLKKAARAVGRKSIEMLPLKQLLPLTGYIHGGCSPIGMKKKFPTVIDETAQLFDHICVSAGCVGCNIAVAPEALAEFIDAEFVDIVKAK